MPRLIWSPEALADVQRLYRFLAEKNPDAARRAASAIRDGMQILALHRSRDLLMRWHTMILNANLLPTGAQNGTMLIREYHLRETL